MKKSMKLASRGKRFAAGLIDMSVPFVAYVFMTSVLGMNLMSQSSPYGYGNPFGYGYGYGYNYNMPHSSGAVAGVFILLILMVAYIIAEFVLFSKAQSIGKAILGLQVVSSTDGKPFSFWKMVLRECIVKSASSSVFLLGYIWILIDERNRGWHDKILDSYVVDLKETANMYQRAAASAVQAAPKSEARPEIKREDSVDKQLEAAGLKTETPQKDEAIEIQEKVEALEAPEKVEILEAPEIIEVVEVEEDKAEAVEGPAESEVIELAAGDESVDYSIKEDDTETK